RRAHYETTGPEVWRQTDGTIDAFVASTGTGGTLAGVSRYLKEQSKDVKIVLADPAGSALYNYVKKGELETTEGPSLGEGIGSTRLTDNLADTEIDDAITIADPECVAMVYRLLYEDGLFMGGSTGVNVAAATRVAREMGPGHTIVTILADGGGKYMSRLFNRRWLAARGLTAP
ncbi:MAG: pyridoxal-phosphate dependent enzyme, partial [Gammaproteobacteria bacterium]